MLTDEQIRRVWSNLLAAETRAMYISDLASEYARYKQWITGLTFFLSSGAAATIIGKGPTWIPVVLALATAAMSAYAIATGLDRKISTLATLSSSWREIGAAYDRLWNHVHDPDAEAEFQRIVDLERSPSEIATTETPKIDEKRLEHWQERVFRLHGLTA